MTQQTEKQQLESQHAIIAARMETLVKHVPSVAEFVQLGEQAKAIIQRHQQISAPSESPVPLNGDRFAELAQRKMADGDSDS